MSTAPPPPPKKKPKVLVVEDEAYLQRMVSRMLADVAEVSTASDGIKALELLNGGLNPDVVITDIMMPNMDGYSLAKKMKTIDALAKTPVIMLTAKGTPQDMIEGINAGARHYITKPFRREDLVEKVQKLVKRK